MITLENSYALAVTNLPSISALAILHEAKCTPAYRFTGAVDQTVTSG
jgi:hypothetical protein